MIAKVPSSSDNKIYAPIPAGTHVARCVSIVDLGTQTSEYMGEQKKARKIRVTWETPNETTVFKEENGEQPYLVSKTFTLSLHIKSGLRKAIESWLGRKLTEKEEQEGYNLEQLLGKECIINVVHNEVNDKVYANVDSISPLMKGMICPAQITESTFFSLEKGEYNDLTFDSFGEWLQAIIAKSPEYLAVTKVSQPKQVQPEGDEIDLDEVDF